MAEPPQGLPALEHRPHLAPPLAPWASAVDSPSVPTASQGGAKGYDDGQKVNGRKRHIWVDSLGLLLLVAVTGADVPDAEAACDLLHRRLWDELRRWEVVCADRLYRAACLQEEVFDVAPFGLRVVSRPADTVGFVRLPQR